MESYRQQDLQKGINFFGQQLRSVGTLISSMRSSQEPAQHAFV